MRVHLLGERLAAERIMSMILEKDTPNSDIDNIILLKDYIENPEQIEFEEMKFFERFGCAIFENPKGVYQELVKMLSDKIQEKNSTFKTYKMCLVLHLLGRRISAKRESCNKNNIIFSREMIKNYPDPVKAISVVKLLEV